MTQEVLTGLQNNRPVDQVKQITKSVLSGEITLTSIRTEMPNVLKPHIPITVPNYTEYIDTERGETLFLDLGGAFESLDLQRIAAKNLGSESLRYMSVDYTSFLPHLSQHESALDTVVNGIKKLIESTGVKKVILKGTSVGGMIATMVAENLVAENNTKSETEKVKIGLIKSHSAERDAESFRGMEYWALELLHKNPRAVRTLWENTIKPYMIQRSQNNRNLIDREKLTKKNNAYFEMANTIMDDYLKDLTVEKAQAYNQLLYELTKPTRRWFRKRFDEIPISLKDIPMLILQSDGDTVMPEQKNITKRYPQTRIVTVTPDGHLGSLTGMYAILKQEAYFVESFQ